MGLMNQAPTDESNANTGYTTGLMNQTPTPNVTSGFDASSPCSITKE